MDVAQLDNPQGPAEGRLNLPDLAGLGGYRCAVPGKDERRGGKPGHARPQETAAAGVVRPAAGLRPEGPQGSPGKGMGGAHEQEEKSGEDGAEGPDGGEVEEDGPRGRPEIRDVQGHEEDKAVHGKERSHGEGGKADGRPLEAVGPTR